MNWFSQSKEKLSKEEHKHLKSVIRKIMNGERDWSPAELQIQQNYSPLIEQLLTYNHERLN